MKSFRILTLLSVLLLVPAFAWASPYATEVVDSQGPFHGSPLYSDPEAVLGKPTLRIANSWGSSPSARIKLVEPAYNRDLQGNNVIAGVEAGGYITVKFDHQVQDDPNNPFGLDFLVFGNGFYTGSGSVTDKTNLNEYNLAGGGWFEEVIVSVSQDGQDWYTYTNGPFGDTAFPTQAFEWDRENAAWTDNEMDFTKPVDPTLAATLVGGGISAADAIEMYNGSGGGTGFDLAESGFAWIQYIKVEGGSGEIDAFSDVAAVPVPGAFWLLGSGLLGLLGWKRKQDC